jgi:hypothetical protein
MIKAIRRAGLGMAGGLLYWIEAINMENTTMMTTMAIIDRMPTISDFMLPPAVVQMRQALSVRDARPCQKTC